MKRNRSLIFEKMNSSKHSHKSLLQQMHLVEQTMLLNPSQSDIQQSEEKSPLELIRGYMQDIAQNSTFVNLDIESAWQSYA